MSKVTDDVVRVLIRELVGWYSRSIGRDDAVGARLAYGFKRSQRIERTPSGAPCWEIEVPAGRAIRHARNMNGANRRCGHESPEIERAQQIRDEINTRGAKSFNHERRFVLAQPSPVKRGFAAAGLWPRLAKDETACELRFRREREHVEHLAILTREKDLPITKLRDQELDPRFVQPVGWFVEDGSARNARRGKR